LGVSKEGIATVWKLDDGRVEGLRSFVLARDGTIREKEDEGRDMEMSDVSLEEPEILVPPLPLIGNRQNTFAGTASGAITPAPFIITESRRYLDLYKRSLRYGEDGDVIMSDWAEWESIEWEDGEELDGDFEDFTWAHQSRDGLLFEGSRWNRSGYRDWRRILLLGLILRFGEKMDEVMTERSVELKLMTRLVDCSK
jgi:hypothetical protein